MWKIRPKVAFSKLYLDHTNRWLMKAKKSLGQHFLNDTDLAIKIVEALRPETKNVLEVGPGPGVLTHFINQKREHFNIKLIELDRRFAANLKTEYPDLADGIEEGDVLQQNWTALFPENFQVIGNFPYNISSQIVFKIIENYERVDFMVGMFQKEMAHRICSPPGKKTYGVISVLTQLFYETEVLFDLPPTAFNPPPKVDSSVIVLRRKEVSLEVPYKAIRRLVKMAFSQRRKMLSNALKTEPVSEMPVFADFASKRAEALSVQDFILLTKENLKND